MVISFFNDGVTGDKMLLPGASALTDSDILDWRDAFSVYLQARLDAEGQERSVVGAKVSVISTDKWRLDLHVAWPDGRSSVTRHTVLFARFNCDTGYTNPRIAS